MTQEQEQQPKVQPATMEGATRVMSMQAEAAAALAVFHEGAAAMNGENMRKLQAAIETMGGQLQKQVPILSSAKEVCTAVEEVLRLWNPPEDSDLIKTYKSLKINYDYYKHQIALSTDGEKSG